METPEVSPDPRRVVEIESPVSKRIRKIVAPQFALANGRKRSNLNVLKNKQAGTRDNSRNAGLSNANKELVSLTN